MAQFTLSALREHYQKKLEKLGHKFDELSLHVSVHDTYEHWTIHVWKGGNITQTQSSESHQKAFAFLQAKLTEDTNDQITVAL